jgi:hypothetical protein
MQLHFGHCRADRAGKTSGQRGPSFERNAALDGDRDKSAAVTKRRGLLSPQFVSED